ncbi:unnamed protein product, partial [Ixodes hexagonus]
VFDALGSIFGKRKSQGDQVAVRESQVGNFVVYGNVIEENRVPDYSRLPYPGGPLYPPLAQPEHMQGAAASSSGDKGNTAAQGGCLDGVPFVLGATASGAYQGSRDVEATLRRVRALATSLLQLQCDYSLERRVLQEAGAC